MPAMYTEITVVSQVTALTVRRAGRAGHNHPAHFHPYYQIQGAICSEIRFELGKEKQVRLGESEALLIPPMVWHRYVIPPCGEFFSLKFHVTPKYWTEFGGSVRRFPVLSPMQERIRELHRRIHSDDGLAHPEAVAVMTLCLLDAHRGTTVLAAPLTSREPFVAKLQPWMYRVSRDPLGAWTVSRLASECHVSADYFCKRFHALFGKSPHEFLMETRIRAAANALSTIPGRPIKEIAELARYTSVHTFSRAFKQVMGVSPGTYRRRGLA
jgi:AraC-like DNA-binding protein